MANPNSTESAVQDTGKLACPGLTVEREPNGRAEAGRLDLEDGGHYSHPRNRAAQPIPTHGPMATMVQIASRSESGASSM